MIDCVKGFLDVQKYHRIQLTSVNAYKPAISAFIQGLDCRVK